MRIIGGIWRGKPLSSPAGQATRPTAQRMRQALFDMLMHAPWGGRALIDGASVLDAFAGTGALGLEALSRGAAQAAFIDSDAAALAAIRRNVAACKADDRARIIAADALKPPVGIAQTIVFLDPPYHAELLLPALLALRLAGWIDAGTIIVAEAGRAEEAPASENAMFGTRLAHKAHGAAQIGVWRTL